MKKSDFYNDIKRDIELKRTDISVAKNKGYYGETIKLTIFKQLEPLRTNSINTITVICNRNIVTIIEYDSGLHDNSKKLISTIDYNHNPINMVVLTANTVIDNIK